MLSSAVGIGASTSSLTGIGIRLEMKLETGNKGRYQPPSHNDYGAVQ